MGHKKHNHHSRSKQRAPPKNAAAGGGGASPTTTASTGELRQKQSKAEQLDSTFSPSILDECKPALAALNHHKYLDALNLIKEVSLRHESSSLVYRIQATIYSNAACQLDDDDDGAKKILFFKKAAESAKLAVLLSPNSIDFVLFYAKILYLVSDDSNDRKDFEEVIRVCDRGLSIDNPIDPAKDSYFGERKFKDSLAGERIAFVKKELQELIQSSKRKINGGIRCGETEDSPNQSRRPNEIKKATKTPEQQKKEIEVQLAMAKLLQQNGEENVSPSSRHEKRRKSANVKKIQSCVRMTEQVKAYFKSMSDEKRLRLLETRVCDLRAHLSSFKDCLAEEILSEAISFVEQNGTWKFWICCCCDEKFTDSESHLHHLRDEHMKKLSLKLQSVVAVEVAADWVEMLENSPWKPVDTTEAVRIIENQPKCTDCSECTVTFPVWPCSDDSERAEILGGIGYMFQLLLKHKYLAESHLDKIMQYTMDELEILVPSSQLLMHGLGQCPLCICFLGASQLELVLQFLQELAHVCGLNTESKMSVSMEDPLNGNQGYEISEKIILTGDNLLCVQLMPYTHDNSVADNGTAATSADSDSFLNWLSASLPTGEQLASWTRLCDDKKHQGVEIVNVLEKKFSLVESICEKKCEFLRYEEALYAIECIRAEENEKREQDAKYVRQSYGCLLRKHKEELKKRNDNDMSSSSRVELDIVSNVLQEAQTIDVNHLGSEEILTGVTPSLCDLEHAEDRECKLQEEEEHINNSLQRRIDYLSTKLSKIDARIMRSVADMKQLETKLARVSAHDYRSIMLPLLRSFMRASLEDLVDKDATEKSEALLAEIALDAKENISKGGNQTKHSQEKSKNGKKNKDRRKAKNAKAIRGNEQPIIQEEDAKQVQLPFAYDGDHSNPESNILLNANELQGGEELAQRTELEAQERKLEEVLGYQRRVENEAKQKQLAEQNEETGGTIPAKFAETITIGTVTVPILYSKHSVRRRSHAVDNPTIGKL